MKKLIVLIVTLSFLSPMVASAAVTFLEPGGSATYGFELWSGPKGNDYSISTAHVHGGQPRSIRLSTTATPVYSWVDTQDGVTSNAGGRGSIYVYFPSVSPAAANQFINMVSSGGATTELFISLSSTGKLTSQWKGGTLVTGTTTVPANSWQRISFAWSWSSTTVNEFRLWLDGTMELTKTNDTTSTVALQTLELATEPGAGANFLTYYSDIYIDNTATLTDPAGAANDLFVTAKRPFANGTAVDFTTGIGADPGTTYGSGHAMRENERALSTTNGWSGVTTSSTTLNEEYNIESISAGDANLTGSTILGVIGWMYANWDSGTNQTAGIIVDGTYTAKSLTTSYAMYQQVSPNPTTYPAGTGTDIGMRKVTTTSASRTGRLAEAGILVAYTPALPVRVIRLSGKVKFTGKVKVY